jgi:manganese transport protein
MLIEPRTTASAAPPAPAAALTFAPAAATLAPAASTLAPAAPTLAPAVVTPAPARARVAPPRLLTLLGPAFIAAIAYVDPGNFATNVSGGATFGYTLLWVVVLANVVAMLVQYLSAKLGVATGMDLARLCGDRLPRPARWAMWAQAELVAMATDLAEFVGAAVALQLLFGLDPLPAGGITAVVAFAVLALRRHGRRPFEVAIVGLLAVVVLGFGYELLTASPTPADVAGGLVPTFQGTDSLLLASGIVGATVMPHAVYVHSAMAAGLSPRRMDHRPDAHAERRLLNAQRLDVLIALGVAGFVNVAMLVTAAALFHGTDLDVSDLAGAHAGMAAVAGGGAALVFAVALLASGLSSASVGTCAGDVVMNGLLRRRMPSTLRRAVTMLPALVLLGSGADSGTALVLSQVVLSFGIPFTLLPLVALTSKRSVMGQMVNRRLTTVAGGAVAAAITALNVFLIVQVVGG